MATETNLIISLVDGRVLFVPLDWYPRLKHGPLAERSHWELIGDGEGIHWPDLDEDLAEILTRRTATIPALDPAMFGWSKESATLCLNSIIEKF